MALLRHLRPRFLKLMLLGFLYLFCCSIGAAETVEQQFTRVYQSIIKASNLPDSEERSELFLMAAVLGNDFQKKYVPEDHVYWPVMTFYIGYCYEQAESSVKAIKFYEKCIKHPLVTKIKIDNVPLKELALERLDWNENSTESSAPRWFAVGEISYTYNTVGESYDVNLLAAQSENNNSDIIDSVDSPKLSSPLIYSPPPESPSLEAFLKLFNSLMRTSDGE